MNTLSNIVGEICKTLLPIHEEVFFGNPKSSISICTLSSIQLLKGIANSTVMKKVAVVGRLLSENKGIDSIVQNVISNKNIKIIILCGKEVSGHRAGHSLLALHENGIDNDGRIIDSTSPEPLLKVSKNKVKKFQNKVKIINKIGITNLDEINQMVQSLTN